MVSLSPPWCLRSCCQPPFPGQGQSSPGGAHLSNSSASLTPSSGGVKWATKGDWAKPRVSHWLSHYRPGNICPSSKPPMCWDRLCSWAMRHLQSQHGQKAEAWTLVGDRYKWKQGATLGHSTPNPACALTATTALQGSAQPHPASLCQPQAATLPQGSFWPRAARRSSLWMCRCFLRP